MIPLSVLPEHWIPLFWVIALMLACLNSSKTSSDMCCFESMLKKLKEVFLLNFTSSNALVTLIVKKSATSWCHHHASNCDWLDSKLPLTPNNIIPIVDNQLIFFNQKNIWLDNVCSCRFQFCLKVSILNSGLCLLASSALSQSTIMLNWLTAVSNSSDAGTFQFMMVFILVAYWVAWQQQLISFCWNMTTWSVRWLKCSQLGFPAV